MHGQKDGGISFIMLDGRWCTFLILRFLLIRQICFRFKTTFLLIILVASKAERAAYVQFDVERSLVKLFHFFLV